MRVLGIDPGSVKCGYGLIDVEGAKLRYVECGVLSAPSSHGKWVRIRTIGNELAVLLAEHPWGLDDLCGVESAFVHPGRSNGVEALAEARGALCYVAMCVGLEIHMVAPSTVKKAVTGHGHADKLQVAEMVRVQLGMRNLPDPDAADALGVAVAIARGAGS